MLCFTTRDLKLEEFVNADLANDIDSRKSTTAFMFALDGTAVIIWFKLAESLPLLTKEAECAAMTEAPKEMV